jgi:hypothetical protein
MNNDSCQFRQIIRILGKSLGPELDNENAQKLALAVHGFLCRLVNHTEPRLKILDSSEINATVSA